MEESLVEIWSQLLGIDQNHIGIDDNFFELGGHSLKATRLAGRIHKELEVKIPLVKMFEIPTIRSLGLHINRIKKSHLEAIESALLAAAQKDRDDDNLRIAIDRKTFDIKAYKILSDGTEIETIAPDFGRISAQTAKQTIMQRIRQAEKARIFEDFKDRAGEIVTGTVTRFDRNDVIIDLDHAEAMMPSKERVPTEEYEIGERIRAYIVAVKELERGPEIVLSRNHPDFVRRLFELEVSEITDGTMEIKGIAREAGFRSKVAVISHDERVDPVGACVGIRGMRVKNIVREL